MKRVCAITLAFIATLGMAMASCSDNEPETPEKTEQEEQKPDTPDNGEENSGGNEGGDEHRILVAYYSHSGNTRTIAGYIHDAAGGDIISVETVNPYPEDYDEHLAQARKEVAEGYLPPLKTKIDNIDGYDVVFVGYPIWVETAAPPIASFLASHDFKGKTIVPFCTSGTSSAAASYRLIASHCPDSKILEGIQIRRGTYDTAHERVIDWLTKLGFLK